jgi:hypothetical protein
MQCTHCLMRNGPMHLINMQQQAWPAPRPSSAATATSATDPTAAAAVAKIH